MKRCGTSVALRALRMRSWYSLTVFLALAAIAVTARATDLNDLIFQATRTELLSFDLMLNDSAKNSAPLDVSFFKNAEEIMQVLPKAAESGS